MLMYVYQPLRYGGINALGLAAFGSVVAEAFLSVVFLIFGLIVACKRNTLAYGEPAFYSVNHANRLSFMRFQAGLN